jgi:hypothetical protein
MGITRYISLKIKECGERATTPSKIVQTNCHNDM